MLNDIVRKSNGRSPASRSVRAAPQAAAERAHPGVQDVPAEPERTPRYIGETIHSAVGRDACKFDRINDIAASRVQEFWPAAADGKSISSSNHYLRAIKMFTRWLVRDRRTDDNRLAHLSTLNEDVDRRHVRRPLTPDEFAWLIEAAEGAKSATSGTRSGPPVHRGAPTRLSAERDRLGDKAVVHLESERDADRGGATRSVADRRATASQGLCRADPVVARTKPRLGPTRPLFKVTNGKTSEIIRRLFVLSRRSGLFLRTVCESNSTKSALSDSRRRAPRRGPVPVGSCGTGEAAAINRSCGSRWLHRCL